MNLCAVNGRAFDAKDGLTTWGQLLETLEQGAGPDRPVVTAVRFDGVDQPSFRDPDLLAKHLQTVGPIDVDTCQTRALIAEAVENGLSALAAMSDAAQQTADAFRSHDINDANGRLVEVVDALQTLTQLTSAVCQAVALDPATPGGDATALLTKLKQSLEWLVQAAENQDWISAADVLQYDIPELIPRWQAVLLAAADPAGQSAPVAPAC